MNKKQKKQLANQSTLENKRKKKFLILTVVLIASVLLIVLVVALCVIFSNIKEDKEEKPINAIDFNRQITDINGEEFEPIYNAESDSDLSIRFIDIECNEDCSNVFNLKIGDSILVVGEDYEIRKGSIIVTIYKKVLQTIKDGQYDITFEVDYNDETIFVGVKVTINSAPLSDTEELDEENVENDITTGRIEDKETLQPVNTSNHASTSNEPSNAPDSSVIGQPQSGRLKINLNDPSYTVSYYAVHSYRVDENRNPIYENGELTSYRVFAICTIFKDGVQIHKIGLKSSNYSGLDGRVFLTEQEFAGASEWVSERGDGYDGNGSFIGPAAISNFEHLCGNCDVECGRW